MVACDVFYGLSLELGYALFVGDEVGELPVAAFVGGEYVDYGA